MIAYFIIQKALVECHLCPSTTWPIQHNGKLRSETLPQSFRRKQQLSSLEVSCRAGKGAGQIPDKNWAKGTAGKA